MAGKLNIYIEHDGTIMNYPVGLPIFQGKLWHPAEQILVLPGHPRPDHPVHNTTGRNKAALS